MIDPLKVQRIMRERGWTQTELQRRSGVSQTRISNIMNANEPINCYEGTVKKIARALNVDPATIRPDADGENQPLNSFALELAGLVEPLDEHGKNIVRNAVVGIVNALRNTGDGIFLQPRKEFGRTPQFRTSALQQTAAL